MTDAKYEAFLGTTRLSVICYPEDRMPRRAIFALCSAQVGAGTGIHPDCLTFFNKQRRLDRFPGLQFYGLLDIGCAIPTKALGRFNDFEND